MFLNLRPSKVVYARHLRKYMSMVEPYATVLDCACAHGKNRYLFPGKAYTGIDIDGERIDAAKMKYADDESCLFYHDDMVHPKSSVTDQQFDLVVSTHTLSHITKEMKQTAVENLARLTKTGGSLIIQANRRDEDSLVSIKSLFDTVHVDYYRGRPSRGFEHWLERFFRAPLSVAAFRTGERGGIFRRTKYLIYAISWLFSFIDGLGYRDSLMLFGFRKR